MGSTDALLERVDFLRDKTIRDKLRNVIRDANLPRTNSEVIARGLTVNWSADRTNKEIHLQTYAHRPRTASESDDEIDENNFYTLTTQVYDDAIVMRAPFVRPGENLGREQRLQYDPGKGQPIIHNFVPSMWQFLLAEFKCNFAVHFETNSGRIGLQRIRGSPAPDELDIYYDITEGLGQNTALRVPISGTVWTVQSLTEMLLRNANAKDEVQRVKHQDLVERSKELAQKDNSQPMYVDSRVK